jgi:hypothetical protein
MSPRSIADLEQETSQALSAAHQEAQETVRAALEKRASCADKPVQRFCKGLIAVDPATCPFARVEGVEPTNPPSADAERTLRRAVIWRNVSFGNHREAGCRFAERMLTVVQTLRLQHRCVLD